MFPSLVGPGMSKERVSQHRDDVGAGDREAERILLRKGRLGGETGWRELPRQWGSKFPGVSEPWFSPLLMRWHIWAWHFINMR